MADTPAHGEVFSSGRRRPKPDIITTHSVQIDASTSQSDSKHLACNVTPTSARCNNDGYRRSSSRQSHVIGHVSTDAALLDAVCAGDDVTVLELLQGARHDVGVPSPKNIKGLVDAKHRPVLCLSVEKSASPIVMKALLQHGASPDDRILSTRQTALHISSKLGYQVCADLLLSFGANPDSVDIAGNTPLMLACLGGHSSIVRLLIQYGAKADATNASRQTALHLTANGRHDGGILCAKVLLTETECPPSTLDKEDRTPLLLAAINNQVELAMLLLDYDSTVETINIQDLPTGQTCLHWAVRHQATNLVGRLIHLGANVNIRDRDWNTPFMVAVTCRHRDVLTLLINAGCDMQVTDRQFNTALHLISRDGLHDLIGILLDPLRSRSVSNPNNSDHINGLDVNLKGHGGVTALMLAANKGHVHVVRELLKVGADPDTVDRHRATALMYALLTTQFIEPCPAVIKMLIRYNCDINKPANVKEFCKFWAIPAAVFRSSNLEDERLYTPLEVAFLRGQVTAFSILVRAGSDLTHFRWLLNLNSGPAFANSLSHWVLPSASMTSSGGKAAAAMVRCARHRLREFDACHSVVPPLISLCIRPALQVLIADARRRHIELIDVVASLSSDVTDNVRRLLTFSHLDDVIPLSPSSVASPTSPPCGQDFIEWPAVDKPIAADCGTPSNGKTASSLLFNSVPKTSRSLPQTPAYLPKPRCQSPPKQPDNFVYSDINSNVTVTSSDRRFGKISQTPTRGRMLPRPKSSASDRYQYDTTVRSTLLTNSNARVTSAQSRSDETARRAVIPPRPKSSASDRKQFVRRPLSVTPMHAYDASGVTRPGEPLRRRLPSTPVNEAGGSRP